LAVSYIGTVHNNTVNETSGFSLTSVKEDAQGNITGRAFINQPLSGSGPFQGSVKLDNTIQFTITSTDTGSNIVGTIRCTGTIQSNGSMSGTYTVPNTGETGTWQGKPS
jgi:hypothetical protein